MTGTEAAPPPRHSGRTSRLFVAALFVLAIFVLVRSLAPQTIGEQARRQLLAQLQEHYRGFSVSIRKGRYDPGIGFVFEDVRVSEPASVSKSFRAREMVRLERMIVFSDVHPEKLLDQENPLVTRRVIIDGVKANAWIQDDGQLSLASLLPLPQLGPICPRIEVHDAKLRLLDDHADARPINVELSEVLLLNDVHSDGRVGRTVTLRGTADFANDFQLQSETTDRGDDIRGRLQGVHLSRSLFDRLPHAWSQLIQHARDLDCVCDATLAVHQSKDGKTNYQIRTTIHDGRFNHPELPRPISQLRGVAVLDPGGVQIEASHCKLGDAICRISGRVQGYSWPVAADLQVSIKGLLLDERLAAALPDKMRQSWDRIQPYGQVDIDAHLTHANLAWNTDATVLCNGVDVRYAKFPYPVEQLVGRVSISEGIVSSEAMDGRIGGQRLQCAFKFPMRPETTKERTFVVQTEGPVAIDDTLIDALSQRGVAESKLESFVRSLKPRGSMHLVSAALKTDAAGRQARKFDVRIVDGHLRYDYFAYPLYNVDGTIRVENDLVTLEGFRATNANAGLIQCDGTYKMPSTDALGQRDRNGTIAADDASRSRLDLRFRAANVPMDDSLRSSLPEATRHTWDSLAPSGILDELNVDVTKLGSGTPLALDVTARQHDHQQVTSRTLSLRPTSLPYRLDITGGTVRFDGSRVSIDSLTGQHDGSKLAADGSCIRDASGRWALLLNVQSGSRLHPDAELIAALPDQMREAMRRLQLRGPVNVRGQTRLLLPDSAHAEPTIDWDLVLQLEGNRIADVGPVHSLRGELSIKGTQDELGFRAAGDVQIDSMHVYDLQVTRIRGPYFIQGDRLRLGSLGQSSVAGTIESPVIQGRLFDGTLDLHGDVVLSSGNFNVTTSLQDAQVPTLLADLGHVASELTGTFSGQAQLEGNLGTTDLLKGNGTAKVTGANLYQLPLIVQVLNQLRITPTEDVAFTDGEVEFTVFGELITFNELQIWGDLVALHGGGTLDRKRELDLTFNTKVSPQNSFTQLLRPLSSQRYTLWTIDVKGPISSPEIERRALDGVGETLERLFPVISADQDSEPVDRNARGLRSWFNRG